MSATAMASVRVWSLGRVPHSAYQSAHATQGMQGMRRHLRQRWQLHQPACDESFYGNGLAHILGDGGEPVRRRRKTQQRCRRSKTTDIAVGKGDGCLTGRPTLRVARPQVACPNGPERAASLGLWRRAVDTRRPLETWPRAMERGPFAPGVARGVKNPRSGRVRRRCPVS